MKARSKTGRDYFEKSDGFEVFNQTI